MCCIHKSFQMFLLCASIQMHKPLEVCVGYWRFQGKASSFYLFVSTLEPGFLRNPNFFLLGNRRHHDPFSFTEICACRGPGRMVLYVSCQFVQSSTTPTTSTKTTYIFVDFAKNWRFLNKKVQLALPHCPGLPYWHYHLVLSCHLHQPESYQFRLQKVC